MSGRCSLKYFPLKHLGSVHHSILGVMWEWFTFSSWVWGHRSEWGTEPCRMGLNICCKSVLGWHLLMLVMESNIKIICSGNSGRFGKEGRIYFESSSVTTDMPNRHVDPFVSMGLLWNYWGWGYVRRSPWLQQVGLAYLLHRIIPLEGLVGPGTSLPSEPGQ